MRPTHCHLCGAYLAVGAGHICRESETSGKNRKLPEKPGYQDKAPEAIVPLEPSCEASPGLHDMIDDALDSC